MMYVNPFWMGVLLTIVVEVVAVIIIGIAHPRGGDREGGHDRTGKDA